MIITNIILIICGILLHLASALIFAIPAGFGLGVGFNYATRFNKWRETRAIMKKPTMAEVSELKTIFSSATN